MSSKEYRDDNIQGDNEMLAENISDDSYVSRTGQSTIPVQKDSAPVEDPIDPAKADTDEYLAQDEREAIDTSNIIDERTRGASKQAGGYREPGDEEGLPGPDDGSSSTRR